MPCIHPDTRFRNGSCAATKWRETTPNMSFGPKEVDWACSLQKKAMVPGAQTHALYPPRYSFPQWVTCANEMARNHPKHEFGSKEVDWACSLRKNQQWFRGHKLMPCIHPDTHFRNGSRAPMKRSETTPNMSYGPKEVD